MKLRAFLIGLAALLWSALPSQAQAPSKSALANTLNQCIYPNSSGAVTPQCVNSFLQVLLSAMCGLGQASDCPLVTIPLDPRQFGAKCDGSNGPNYDTTALQAWAAAATNPAGNRMTLPSGCIVNGTITISNPFVLTGGDLGLQDSGAAYATLAQVSPTANTFNIATSQAWVISHIGIRAAVTRTNGADIWVAGDGVNIPTGFVIDGVGFNGSFTCISIPKGTAWKIVNSTCRNYGYGGSGDAIYYPSTGATDTADNAIIGNNFVSGVSGTTDYGYAALYLESAQGLFVQGNKFFGAQFGIELQAKNGSGNLIVNGNSFEQQLYSHIDVAQNTGSGSFGNLIVTNNEFSDLSTVTPPVSASRPTVYIDAGLSAAYGTNVVVANNVFNDLYTTSVPSLAVFDGVGVNVRGNVFNLYSQTGPSSIQVGGYASGVVLGDNIFNGQTSAQHYRYVSGTATMIRDLGLHFADLSNWANGSEVYCVDCTPGSTLTGNGSGAWGRRINGAWVGN